MSNRKSVESQAVAREVASEAPDNRTGTQSCAPRGADHDIDIYPFGEDVGALVAEVKARKNGAGFVTLEKWLGENELLFLVRDRQSPLICLHGELGSCCSRG